MNFRRWLALCAFIGLAACARTPDETRIRDAIAAMEVAAEQHEPRAFMEHVADDFTGGKGSFDRQSLHNVLRAQLLRNESIGIALGPIEVDVKGDRATARVAATLTGGSGSGWLPERGAIYDFRTGWKRIGAAWVCISAEWEQQ